MSYQPILIGAYETIQEAAHRMRAHVVGALPVLESGRLVGIVTDRDLAIRAVATDQRASQTHVRHVMTPDPASCSRDEPLETALALMVARRVRRLVIVNGNREVIGLLSVDDLVADPRTQAVALQVLRGSTPARGELDGELADVT